MGIVVEWSSFAKRTYEYHVDDFIARGSDSKAHILVDRVDEIITHIVKMPRMFSEVHGFPHVHKVVLTPEINMYYRFKNNKIGILSLWPSKSNPQRLKKILQYMG